MQIQFVAGPAPLSSETALAVLAFVLAMMRAPSQDEHPAAPQLAG